MVKVVLFERDPKSIISWLVSIITRSKYSHAGLLVGGLIYDASESRGTVGQGSLEQYRTRRITVYNMPMDCGPEYFLNWMSGQLGRGYDWYGVLGWLLRIQRNEDVYCFEWVMEAICASTNRAVRTQDRVTAGSIEDLLDADPIYTGEVTSYGAY